MDFMAPQKIISRGIRELGCEDEFAEAIGNIQVPPWVGPTRNKRTRLFQALADNHARNFNSSWTLMGHRFFAYFERHDLCQELNGAAMQAQWEGDRMREDGLPIREMIRVRPKDRAHRTGTR